MNKLAFSGLLALSTLLAPVHAADRGKGVVTMTKYVLQFGQMEKAMLAAQSKHDTAALDAMLSPLFELRKASGERVPRGDWLASLASAKVSADAPNQLAVYEVGSEAIANYWLGQPGEPDALFFVDVWVQVEGKWLLRARFQSPGH
jgi:hypothetical protein